MTSLIVKRPSFFDSEKIQKNYLTSLITYKVKLKVIMLIIAFGFLLFSCTVSNVNKKRQGYRYSSKMMNHK